MTSVTQDRTARELAIEHVEGCTTATLHGELTYCDVDWWLPDLLQVVSEPNARLIIDLSHIEEIDSGALGRLVGLVAEGNTRSSHVILAGPRPCVAGVLEVTRLDRFFEITPDAAEAQARFAVA